MTKDLVTGALTLKEGCAAINRPGLRRYAIIPLAFNIILVLLLINFAIDMIEEVLSAISFSATLPGFLSWLQPAVDLILGFLDSILLIAATLLLLFIMGSVFTAMVHLISAPFGGLLAEKVETSLRPANFPDYSIPQFIARTFSREIQRLTYWLVRAALLVVVTLILNFIPVINLLNPVIWLVFGAWMIGMQYIDFAADNNGLSFEETLKKLKQRRALVVGFGMITLLATIIPLLNLFIVPVAVAGGTILWVKHIDCPLNL